MGAVRSFVRPLLGRQLVQIYSLHLLLLRSELLLAAFYAREGETCCYCLWGGAYNAGCCIIPKLPVEVFPSCSRLMAGKRRTKSNEEEQEQGEREEEMAVAGRVCLCVCSQPSLYFGELLTQVPQGSHLSQLRHTEARAILWRWTMKKKKTRNGMSAFGWDEASVLFSSISPDTTFIPFRVRVNNPLSLFLSRVHEHVGRERERERASTMMSLMTVVVARVRRKDVQE